MKVALKGRTHESERRRRSGVKSELVVKQEANRQLRALNVRHVKR